MWSLAGIGATAIGALCDYERMNYGKSNGSVRESVERTERSKQCRRIVRHIQATV